MRDDERSPVPGVGIMIVKDGKVLMGKRLKGHGAGTYAFPGGHLEFGESIIDCVHREVAEEVGIEVKNPRLRAVIGDRSRKFLHYIEFAIVVDWDSGEPQNREPDKCAGWDWYDMDNMPEPLFTSMLEYIAAYRCPEYNLIDIDRQYNTA